MKNCKMNKQNFQKKSFQKLIQSKKTKVKNFDKKSCFYS